MSGQVEGMTFICSGESAAGNIRMDFDYSSHRSKLQSNQGWAPPPPQGQYVPHPPPAAAVGGSGGKTALIALTVALVIIMASIGTYVMLNLSDDDPAEAATDFSELLGNGDFEGAYNATILSLDDDYDEYVKSQETAFGDNLPHLSVDNTSFTSPRDMAESEKEDAQDLVDDIESEYDVRVDDYCLMVYTVTVDYGDFEETITDEMLCVKIYGVWYMTEAFDIYPSVMGSWEMQYMEYMEDGQATTAEGEGLIFVFGEGGTGYMHYDEEPNIDDVKFTWNRTARDKIVMELGEATLNCTYTIDGERLQLTATADPIYGTIVIALDRFSGPIHADDDAVFATDFTLPQVGGGNMKLSSLRGKVVVLDFMATWCGPCETELDHLKTIYSTYNSSILAMVSIDVDPGENETLLTEYIAEQDIPWPVLMDTSGVSGWSAYQAYSIPLIIIVDQEGYIRFRHVGVTDSATLMAEIETLM